MLPIKSAPCSHLCAGVMMALSSFSMGALASTETHGGNASWQSQGSVMLISDYAFRGISQTDEGPAVQAGYTLSHDSGWYGSLWGSNIEFGDGSLELDLSAGWAKDWDNGLTTDLGVIRYQYSQDDTDLSYNEIYAVVSYADAKLGLVYSPDYFGEDVDDFQYVYASYEPQLFFNVSLVLHLGSNFFASQQDMALFLGSMAASNSHYLDWRVGLNLNMTEQDVLSVGYVDTDLSQSQCQSLCDARWIVSLSRSF